MKAIRKINADFDAGRDASRGDECFVVDCSNNDVTLTMPPASLCIGQEYMISRNDSVTATTLAIEFQGDDSVIPGGSTFGIAVEGNNYIFVSYGEGYYLVSNWTAV